MITENGQDNSHDDSESTEKERLKKIMARPIALKATAWYWRINGKLAAKDFWIN